MKRNFKGEPLATELEELLEKYTPISADPKTLVGLSSEDKISEDYLINKAEETERDLIASGYL